MGLFNSKEEVEVEVDFNQLKEEAKKIVQFPFKETLERIDKTSNEEELLESLIGTTITISIYVKECRSCGIPANGSVICNDCLRKHWEDKLEKIKKTLREKEREDLTV